jgi:hypothetical protein
VGLLADNFGLSATFLVLGGVFALALPLAGKSFLHHNRA